MIVEQLIANNMPLRHIATEGYEHFLHQPNPLDALFWPAVATALGLKGRKPEV